ncbi:MAG: VacJ family lipoprotein [Gammaproteobacteria bacterium]|nr:VacJ family lipoprotein [Gammaproteobacteria bacterium]
MKQVLVILCVGSLLGGCATLPPGEPVDYDPWEKQNRRMFRFNEAVDKATLKPIAKGYRKIIPEPVRNSVTNFSRNLGAPRNVVNNFLQGKPKRGVEEILRFVVNTTFGIGGLFDVATKSGLEPHPEGFGQTAAVWGVPSGPYLMIPFLGPQTLRDVVLLPANIELDIVHHLDESSVRDRLWGLRTIDVRHRVLSLEELLQDSKDPYVSLRESYLQNREFEIYDGDPPMDDEDEDLYDEFLEEEDY